MNNNPNKYHYEDNDNIYTYSNGVLKNKLGITNQKELDKAEKLHTTKRLTQLKTNPIPLKNISTLFKIHHHIFQDLYDWAGKLRKIGIKKDGDQFSPTYEFKERSLYINSLINDYKQINPNNKLELSRKLAEILDEINWMHPFREGNGRTQREFLCLLAKEKNYTLDLNPPDKPEVYQEYMQGTVFGAIGTLTHLIHDCIKKQSAVDLTESQPITRKKNVDPRWG
jgi:cell filamentation protein